MTETMIVGLTVRALTTAPLQQTLESDRDEVHCGNAEDADQ